MRLYQDAILTNIGGIDCAIAIYEYEIIKPWAGSILDCPSDVDYYGYEDIEYGVIDEQGNELPEMEAQITDEIDKRIREQIKEFYEERFIDERG